MLYPGQIIDKRYRILSVIGQGGMSNVYLAVNERSNRFWAVKERRKGEGKDDAAFTEAIKRECEILKKLNHPSLPQIVDVIDEDESFYIIMDYIEGKNLKQIIEEEGKLPEDKLTQWGTQLCDVLTYLHSRKPCIIYGDMKPENIVIKEDNTLVLVDFGLAIDTGWQNPHSSSWGTYGYVAPERLFNGSIDIRTDIYSLGATLAFLAYGRSLEPSSKPDNKSIFSPVEKIIHKCMEEDPKKRYASCEDVKKALEKCRNKGRFLFGRRKWFLCIFLGLLIGSVSIISCYQYMTSKELSQRYDMLLDKGNKEVLKENQIAYYQEATSIMPGRKEAFLSVLETCFMDQIFTMEEETAIKAVLYGQIEQKEHIEYLKEDASGYEEVCYELAVGYFFFYEGFQGKRMAAFWFQEALENCCWMNEETRKRAVIYQQIGTYYYMLGINNKSDEQTAGYDVLYENLSELNQNELHHMGTDGSALTLYQEIAGTIQEYAHEFLKIEEITANDLYVQLDKIEQRVEAIEGQEERVRLLRRTVTNAEENIRIAEERYSRRTDEEN